VTPAVRVAGEEPNGLADLLARLLEGNLERDPRRLRLLRPGSVVVVAADADLAATVELAPGRATVADADPSRTIGGIRIRAAAGDLLALAGAPLLFGVPNPFRRDGRDVLRRIVTGRVRISGMLRHPLALTRFARLLSVA
jgi:hypothetical protein